MRKTFYPCLIFFGLFVLGGAVYPAVNSAVNSVWEYLVFLFPDRLKTYSAVTDPEGYAVYATVSGAVSVFLLILLISYVSLRTDNGRFEYTAKLHDGRFHLTEGYLHYFREYFISDVVISSVPTLLLTFPAALLPKRFMNAGFDVPFWCGGALVPCLGLASALVAALVVAIVARTAAALIAVRRYRAAWLSGGI